MTRIQQSAIAIALLSMACQLPAFGQCPNGYWSNQIQSAGVPSSTFWGPRIIFHDDGNGPALFVGLYGKKWNLHRWVQNPGYMGGEPFIMHDAEGPTIYGWEDLGEHGLFKWDGTEMVPVATLPFSSYGCQEYTAVPPFQAVEIGGARTWFGRGYYDECHGQIYKHDLLIWDGLTWERTNANFQIQSMAAFNGELYVSAAPDPQFCTPVGPIYRRLPDGTLVQIADLLWDGCAGSAYDMLTYDDGSGPALFISGAFRTVNGQPIKSVAKWDGFAWTQVGEGIEGGVYDLEIWHHDGVTELIAAGRFSMAGTQPAENIAVWNGTQWRSFGSGTDYNIWQVETADLPWRRSIFFSGGFATAGGLNSPSLAEWVCFDCRANCDDSTGQGVLDVFDFLCFQNSFVNAEPYACDCDTTTGNGVCDIFDFVCFQDAFVAGCP